MNYGEMSGENLWVLIRWKCVCNVMMSSLSNILK